MNERSAQRRPSLLFVGPLPPPVHGFSTINAAMLAAFGPSFDVTVFDRAPAASPGRFAAWRNLARLAGALRRFAAACREKPDVCYLALSGGLGQWADLPFLWLARRCGASVAVHHHSFAYLRRPSMSSRRVVQAAGDALHIVLCETMGRLLTSSHRVRAERLFVLSNVAFVDGMSVAPLLRTAPQPVNVGFLSNISEDKGIFDFLGTIDAARRQGLRVEARIAGPVSDDIATRFAEAVGRIAAVTYVGAVYGESKRRFLDGLDVLLFPTRYVNEAEPVVIFEAMGAGLVVVAAMRGCITEMMSDEDRGTAVEIDRFSATSIELLARYDADRPALLQKRLKAQSTFRFLRAEQTSRLALLVRHLADAGSP